MFISEVLKKGWGITKENFFFFLSVIVVYFVLLIGGAWVLNKLRFIGQILFIILSFWLGVGLIIIALKKAKDENASLSDLFSGAKYLLSFIGASILYYLIIFAGTILLIFPAVIWGIKYMFFPYLIVDKNMKAIEALKASSKITKGVRWDILGFCIVLEIVNLLGILCLIIGLFWTIPTVLIAYATTYLKLANKI